MAFTLRQLQYFISVAEEGTVSGAAQSLSISQSAVTDAIKELETDLGVTLFERHRRGLTITHKGHQFYRHATRILGSFAKGRGLGDCGDEAQWIWDGRAFQILSMRVMPVCRGVPGDDWPVLYQATVR